MPQTRKLRLREVKDTQLQHIAVGWKLGSCNANAEILSFVLHVSLPCIVNIVLSIKAILVSMGPEKVPMVERWDFNELDVRCH